MSDLIRRDDVVNLLTEHFTRTVDDFSIPIAFFPTTIDYFRRLINRIPTAEPKVAEWEDIQVFEVVGTAVDRLQSTFCPVCRRYHTTPYVYSYNHYDYCPNCGSQMKRRINKKDVKDYIKATYGSIDNL